MTKTDSIVSADLGQSELRVQHHQQKADLVRWSLFTFAFSFRRAELNRRPSDLVCCLTPTVETRVKCIEKKSKKS